ncbi:MAG TPA: YciI family protein [Acidimicrobiales bacterium]|nr:YciI family protein [Acidimicrobiales bacterium]
MPQYLLSVWHAEPYDDLDFNSPDMQRRMAQVSDFNGTLERAGAWVFGTGLRPASTATVVRATGADIAMTDGPFAETKEQMGGFWIIEAADREVALDWASKAALACEGPVELRPTEGA